MLKIAICDDEEYFCNLIKCYLEKYLSKKEISYKIDKFFSGKKFIDMGIEMIQYSIIFLDINMGKTDGITTAKKIREYSKDVIIIFITAYIEYSLEGYKVNAIRYLIKNNTNFENSLEECMDAVLSQIKYIIVKKDFHFNECEKEIILDNLLYIESNLHKLKFHVLEENINIYTLYSTLDFMEKELKVYNFLRIHQSFLVNLKHIKNITAYEARLSSNEILSIPRVRYKDVKKIFVAYKGEI